MENQTHKLGIGREIDATELANLTGIPIDEIKRKYNIPFYSDAKSKFFKCECGSKERENALIQMIELAGNIEEITIAHSWASSDFSTNHHNNSIESRQQAMLSDDAKILRLALRKWAKLTTSINEIKKLLKNSSFRLYNKRSSANIIEADVRRELYEKWFKLIATHKDLSDLYMERWYSPDYKDLNTRILIKFFQFIKSIEKIKKEKSHYEGVKDNSIRSYGNNSYAFDVDLVIKSTVERWDKISLEKTESATTPQECRAIYCEARENSPAKALILDKWNKICLKEAKKATTLEEFKEVCDHAFGDSEAIKVVLEKWRPYSLTGINSATTIEEADKASLWITGYDIEVKKAYLDKRDELSLREVNLATTKEEYAAAFRRAAVGSKAKEIAFEKLTEFCTLSTC
ncbi:MAG: hypothetical protein WC069_07075 [Candidatus Shapirobacteria bacterium]